MADFNMPSSGTWEQRGGWVVNALMPDLNLKIENSAGLVGNLGGESGGFTSLQEEKPMIVGSAGGYGWAQWTGPRRRLFVSWCRDNRLSTDSDEGNYRFLVYELLILEKPALEKIRNADGLIEATRAAHIYYERPSDQSERETNRRLIWAKRALDGAKAQATGGTPIPPIISPPPEAEIISADLITFEMVKPAIQNLQSWLRISGDYDGAIDGIAGPGTLKALADFQNRTRK